MRDITIMRRFVGGEIMLSIEKLYQILYQNMGPQYWWPAETPIEMMLGAILVQCRYSVIKIKRRNFF